MGNFCIVPIKSQLEYPELSYLSVQEIGMALEMQNIKSANVSFS